MNSVKSALSRFYHSDRVQGILARSSLSEPQNQQIAGIVIASVMALLIVSILGYGFVQSMKVTSTSGASNFIPADINDATNVCNTEMKTRLGAKLLRSYVDQHSTRLDNSKGLFRVYIKADIGTVRDFHEIDVYCFVDKWDHSLSHYKEIDPTVKRIMTSDLKFFKD